MARNASLAFFLFLVPTAAVAILGGCPAPEPDAADKICTAGAYVFCRCEDRKEGTKLCSERGNAFGKCICGGNAQSVIPSGDAGFEPVESKPEEGALVISDRCVGKLAVLAATEEEDEADPQFPLFLYGAAYTEANKWTVQRSLGTALRGPPKGGVVNGSLVAVWKGRFDRILWTKFSAGEQALTPPSTVRTTTADPIDTALNPVFVSSAASGRIYYVGDDNAVREDGYSPNSGWDEASAILTPGNPPVTGKSAPAGALVGSNYVVAFGSGTEIFTQAQTSGNWSAPAVIPQANAFEGAAPAMTALASGTEELLLVYQSANQLLNWTVRSGGAWSAPAVVNPSAQGDGVVALAPMAKGRAMLVWTGLDGRPFSSVYDPATDPRWSGPAPVFPNAPKVRKPPTVSSGRCAGEATMTYVDDTGGVNLALFADNKWTGPFVVPGLRRMTWAGAGEVP
jgi:hypothetical protein